jgi:two-component system phosphate regulon response regulator OmpR
MPILLLTARGAPEDIVAGFEAGADDYLGKPFDPRVLLARIRAMLRRAAPQAAPSNGPLQLGEAVFDPARAELVTPTSRIRLTGAELALLVAFAARPHEILTREYLAGLLEMDETSERAIDVQVTRLRRKIEPDPREPRFLHTVRGKGYVLKPGV